jgi:dTDP-6-deoxy-L-talose 4-dehydrogenase (NAD+)
MPPDDFGGAPVLVTGARGFVGRQVVAELRRRRRAVVAVPGRWRDLEEVASRIGPSVPAACVHLGWYADPRDYLTAVGPNAQALQDTLDLGGLLEQLEVPTMIVAGSAAEYAPAEEPLREDARLAPRTVYGSAKALCHELLRSRVRRSGAVTWARLFNLTGPGEDTRRILPAAAKALVEGIPLDLSEGTQVRDYVDVRDAAAALVDLIDYPVDVVNVGTGVGTALRDVLTMMADEHGGHELLRFGRRPFLPEDNPVVVADARVLEDRVGWRPHHDLRSTVRAALDDAAYHYAPQGATDA